MNIAQKYRRQSLIILIIVLIIGCLTEFLIYSYAIRRTTDDVLSEYRCDIEEFAAHNDSLIPFSSIVMKHSRIREVEPEEITPDKKIENNYDSLIYSSYGGEPILYRVLRFPVKTAAEDYIVALTLPTLEQHELAVAIVIASFCLFLLFVMASYFSVRYMRQAMRPFYQMLQFIREFDIRSKKLEKPMDTGLDELNELATGLYSMTSRMQHDYQALKELMENASHELQTPLAIFNLKLEQLAQLCAHNEQQLEYIAEMRRTILRISSFNRSLILISRISSDHFYRQEELCLDCLIDNYIGEHIEIFEMRNISVSWKSHKSCRVKLHPLLSEILINNLMSNALKYNKPHGKIDIDCQERSVSISNTYANIIPEGDLFERYICSKGYNEASGLGLTIVREICLHNNFRAEVNITDELFTITVHNEQDDDNEQPK